jgi:hypothetical protein
MKENQNLKKLPSSVVIYGKTMNFAGFGNFPYECGAKDKYPHAAIYLSTDGSAWTHEYAADFTLRNQSGDHYNQPLFQVSFTSAPLYKVVDCEINRRFAPEMIGKYVAVTIPYTRLKVC